MVRKLDLSPVFIFNSIRPLLLLVLLVELGGCYIPRVTRIAPELRGTVFDGDRPVPGLVISACSSGAVIAAKCEPYARATTDQSGGFVVPPHFETGVRFVATDLPSITWGFDILGKEAVPISFRSWVAPHLLPESQDATCDLSIDKGDRCRLSYRYEARVKKVYDGSSLTIDSMNKKLDATTSVRLAWIVAPSAHQSFQAESAKYLESLIQNRTVTIVRLLHGRAESGIVYVGDVDIGLEMIKAGMAWYHATDYPIQLSNEKKRYAIAAREAMIKRLGVWGKTGIVPPRNVRETMEDYKRWTQ